MNEPSNSLYIKKKPVTDDHILCNFITQNIHRQIHGDKKHITNCQADYGESCRGQGRGVAANEYSFFPGS